MFLSFLFVSHHSLYYCGIKKLNSISDSLLCFFFLRLSLPQTIYKGTTWQPMKLVCSDFALSTLPFSWLPNIFFTFLISLLLMAVPSGIFFFYFVLLCLVISVVEKEWVRMQTEKLKFWWVFFGFSLSPCGRLHSNPQGLIPALKIPSLGAALVCERCLPLLRVPYWHLSFDLAFILHWNLIVQLMVSIELPNHEIVKFRTMNIYVAYIYRETTRYTEM